MPPRKSLVALTLLLSSCAPALVVVPKLPPPLVKEPLGENFQDQMQNFLNGMLPEPKASAPR